MLLLRGAPGSGKTAQIFRDFRASVETGRSDFRIVVPTATLVRHFQHELARDGAVFSPKWILTLSRFASQCAPDVQLAPGGLRRAIVRNVLRSGIAPEFNEVASTEGMIATAIETVDLFENAGATPASMKGKRLQPLGSAFLKLWAATTERIRACGFSTRGDLFRKANANISATGVKTIWMDGFLTFSRLEAGFLKELDQALELTLALPSGPEADEAYRMALGIGVRHRSLEETPNGASIKPARLKPARLKPKTESFTPSTIDREADEICRRVLDLQAGGVEFRDIGIALRDNSTYLALLRTAFERFGIPARFYFADALGAHPATKFLSGLVEGALSGWEFERTLATLRLHPRWCGSASFDSLDFAIREAMPGRGAEALLRLMELLFPDEDHWLRVQVSRCMLIDGWRKENLTPMQWSERLRDMAEMLDDRPVAEAPDYATAAAARSYAAALHGWSAAVREAVHFWAADQAQVALADFWNVARECVDATSVRAADDRRNVVHVMSAFEARQWDVRVLFVCGMTDRDYPRRHPENLLFPDAEAKKLGVAFRSAADMDEEERKLFPSLRLRARELLVLSVPARDSAGRTVVRSRFLLGGEGLPAIDDTPAPRVKPAETSQLPDAPLFGKLQDAVLLDQLAGLHRSIGATGLESLAQCRFQFFARKALRVREAPDRPEDRFNFLVQGNVLHDALKRFAEAARPDILSQFEDAFDEACRKGNIPESYRLEVKRFELRRLVQALDLKKKWESDSSLIEHDLRLRLRDGVEMTGRADRIDIRGDKCIVVDYKSGAAANVQDMVGDATKLQGPLYALAAQRQLGLEPVAMVYWALKNNKYYGWGGIPGLSLEEMPENWMESARVRVVEMIDDYLAGNVPAHPTNEDQCRWCEVREGCRVEVRSTSHA